MPSPRVETRTLDDLVDHLVGLGWLTGTRLTQPLERLIGWESVVVRTADGWIYRFSRLDPTRFARELDVLAAVDGRLPVVTPRVEATDDHGLVMAYRTITGHALDLPGALAIGRAGRRPLVRSLADTLAAMHELDLAGPVLTTVDPERYAASAERGRDRLAAADRDVLDRALRDWRAAPRTGTTVLHGDFHAGNMVFGGPTGALSGLWDFSCVERGDPSDDLRYLVGDSAVLCEEIVQAYRATTGRPVDLRSARLLRLLEDVADAVDEDRPVAPALREAAARLSPDAR